MSGDLVITVHGRPITQGSKVKTRYGMRDDNAKTLKPWRSNVSAAAREAFGDRERITGPVEVYVDFYFDRPATHYRTGRNAHLLRDGAPTRPANVRSGDIDKLQRSCFDALTDAGIWKDDCQVVQVDARKWFVGAESPHPGACIRVYEVTP